MLAIVVALTICRGCASLHIESTDSVGIRIAKGVARVPIAILTFSTSERWHAQQRTMESWLDHREADLLMAWGPPDATLNEGSGGRILVFREQRVHVTPGFAMGGVTSFL